MLLGGRSSRSWRTRARRAVSRQDRRRVRSGRTCSARERRNTAAPASRPGATGADRGDPARRRCSAPSILAPTTPPSQPMYSTKPRKTPSAMSAAPIRSGGARKEFRLGVRFRWGVVERRGVCADAEPSLNQRRVGVVASLFWPSRTQFAAVYPTPATTILWAVETTSDQRTASAAMATKSSAR